MNSYFAAGRLSQEEKEDILSKHRSLYDGYRTMQPQIAKEQPLYVYDPAQDKIGAVVSNKGVVKAYTNVGINEQVEENEVCDECGAMEMGEEKTMCSECGGMMYEGECSECGWKGEVGSMEEETGHLDDIYDEQDLNPNAEFDYVEGASNKTNAFKVKEQAEDYINYHDNTDEEFDEDYEDMLAWKELDEQGYTGGGNAPDMDLSNIEPAYNFVTDGPMAGGDVYPTEGEIDEISFSTRSRKPYTADAVKKVIDYIKDSKTEEQLESAMRIFRNMMHVADEKLRDVYIERIINAYKRKADELGNYLSKKDIESSEEMDEEWEQMESAWSEEMEEANDVSGVQGIYGDMEPAYDFDSEGPGKAGPYQHSSWGGGSESEEENESIMDDEFEEVDDDLKESFKTQKQKIVEMMNRMKIIK